MSNFEKKGNIEEIQWYEEKEIEWKITEFSSIAEDAIIESRSFSFAESFWYFRLRKKSLGKPGFAVFGFFHTKPWEYSVKYTLGLKKLDIQNSVVELFKGFFKGSKTQESYNEIFFKLPEKLEQKCEEAALDTIIITCTLKCERIHSDQISVFNIPKVKKLINTESTPIQSSNSQRYRKDYAIELGTLSENFKDLIANKESCDTTLHVQDREYKAHRAVLTARSSIFAAMFLHDTSEKQTGVITIPDCDPESFEEFLKFLYCGRLEEPSFICALHLYETSDKYDVQELKAFCVEFLMENLTVENMCDAVVLANKYEEGNLLNAAQDFFNKNSNKVIETSQWDCLVKNNYLLSKNLLRGMTSRVKIVD